MSQLEFLKTKRIPWKVVFLVEYFGPIFAFPLINKFFIKNNELSIYQLSSHLLFTLHFLKREFETLFVHKFSHDEGRPLWSALKNICYYWIFSIIISSIILSPSYKSPSSILHFLIGAPGFIIFMLGNLKCHLMLSNLRPNGTKVRQIPKGFVFEYVSAGNYICEILQWFCFYFMNMSTICLIYNICGAAHMIIVAKQKHERYLKEFKDYPKERKIIIPFVF